MFEEESETDGLWRRLDPGIQHRVDQYDRDQDGGSRE